MFVEY